jgi:hypothetical protein
LLAVLGCGYGGVLKSLPLCGGWRLARLARTGGAISGRASASSESSAASTSSGLRDRAGSRGSGDAGHFYGPVFEGWFRADGDLLMNGREAEDLHLDVPDARSEIQSVAAGVVGKGSDFSVAVDGGDGGSGQKLVGGADGTALFCSRRERQCKKKDE